MLTTRAARWRQWPSRAAGAGSCQHTSAKTSCSSGASATARNPDHLATHADCAAGRMGAAAEDAVAREQAQASGGFGSITAPDVDPNDQKERPAGLDLDKRMRVKRQPGVIATGAARRFRTVTGEGSTQRRSGGPCVHVPRAARPATAATHDRQHQGDARIRPIPEFPIRKGCLIGLYGPPVT